MATKTFIGGSSNNAASDPANWTPNGAPTPGDTLLMNSGTTMNIAGTELAGDALTLGQGQANSAYVFSLSNGAVLATTTASYFDESATVNVDGRATATLREGNPSTISYAVNLDAGSTWVGNYGLNFSGITVTAAAGATFENDATSNCGGVAVINADVVGAGSFRVPALQGTAGSLEFGRSVAASETVNLAGNPYRYTGNVKLLIDRPADFHAAVNLSDGTIDLKSLAADSYALSGDTLTLYNAGAAVDTLRVHNTTTATNSSTIVPMSVDRLGADILVSAGANPVAGKVALPVYKPPPPPPTPTPPVIAGMLANQTSVDGQTVKPLSGVTITDTNANAQDSATLFVSGENTLLHAGSLSGSGLVSDGGDMGDLFYHVAAITPAALTAILNNLDYTGPDLASFPGNQTSFVGGITLTVTDGTLAAKSGTVMTETAKQPPTTTPHVTVLDTTTHAAVPDTLSQAYNGPVGGISEQYINLTPDSLNITAQTPNMFIHSGSGSDAINVAATGGTNVLDGGAGSNFLVGGSGTDTFFVDDRGPAADIWSTVVGLHAGDAATVFGVTPTGFAFSWADGQGAPGAMGLTLHASAPGRPTASVTLAGYTKADLANGRIGVAFGSNADSGSYLYIHAN